jgi:hypothetical protein
MGGRNILSFGRWIMAWFWLFLQIPVATGCDRLAESAFAPLNGLRVGLLCNQTARDRHGRHLLELLREAGISVPLLFTPEHGFAANAEGKVSEQREQGAGTRIVSLYGERRSPALEDLAQIDLLLVDLPDVGVRFYTYAATLALALHGAAEAKLPVLVLDRPNPLGGLRVDGPVQDEEREARFISYLPLALVHGMTLGELARLAAAREPVERPVQLEISTLAGWRRAMSWQDCALPWFKPSPNLPSPDTIALYPLLGTVEGLPGLSVGRGTRRPFQFLAVAGQDPASLLQGWSVSLAKAGYRAELCKEWVASLDGQGRPSPYPMAGQSLAGLCLESKGAQDPLLASIALLNILARGQKAEEIAAAVLPWWGHESSLQRLLAGEDFQVVRQAWQSEARYQSFRQARQAALLYPP